MVVSLRVDARVSTVASEKRDLRWGGMGAREAGEGAPSRPS